MFTQAIPGPQKAVFRPDSRSRGSEAQKMRHVCLFQDSPLPIDLRPTREMPALLLSSFRKALTALLFRFKSYHVALISRMFRVLSDCGPSY